jgi:glycosyltransferase involved in cell wall biosynthesis
MMKVRVVHFSDTFLPRRDGIVTALRTLMPELRNAGHEVLLVAPHHPSQDPGEVGLALPSLPTGIAGLRICPPRARYAAVLAGWSPTSVHIHTSGTVGLLGALTARRLGLPAVVTYHTDLHAYADAYRIPTSALRLALRLYATRLAAQRVEGGSRTQVIDAFNRLLFDSADAIIVPSEAILERSPWLAGHARVAVIPTGVAHHAVPADAGPGFRDRWGIPRQAPLVLFVGRVNPEKGVDLLARAFGVVLGSLPDARLVLMGAVYRPRWLRDLLARAGIAHRTIVTGQQPPPMVGAAYAAAHVFAFPSLSDTQGLVLHEAALAGLPSVLVDRALHTASPLREGMLLSGPTPPAFGSSLAELAGDPARARRYGAAARRSAAEMTPRRHCERLISLYRDAQCRRTG